MTRRDVGRFIVNLNVSETSTDPFTINITNRTDDYVSVEFERRSGDINITANRSVGSTTHTQVTCDPSRERVLVDLMRGQSLTSECEFPATRPLDPPYAVTIRNGDRAVGEYGFVVNESLADFNILGGPTGTFDGCDGSVEPDTPCTVPAVWTANVSLEYDSRTITYRQEHNISVYP
jgi:hypothetical protein